MSAEPSPGRKKRRRSFGPCHTALTTTLLLGLCFGILPARTQAAPTQLTEIELQVGEQKVLPSEGVRSYSEGVRGIVDVRLTRDATQFVLVGLKAGITTLLFIMLDGSEIHFRIQVADISAPPPMEKPRGGVEAKDNIRLDFYFVQLDKRYRHQLGVAWPRALGGGRVSGQVDLLSGTLDSATAVVADQALPRLDMAQADGWAKILRQAAVITANGSEARFSGGGEVNIPIQGALAAAIRSITYGSEIQVLPRYDAQTGRIELQIQAEVSDLTDDNGSGVPGRITSNLHTLVNIELGQSLVLGGLSARSENRSREGLPLLSRIPLLGPLFGSNHTREQESENLVLIVPTVVDPVSMEARERIRDALEVYDRYQGSFDRVSLMAASPLQQEPQ